MHRSDSQLALDTLAFALATYPEFTDGATSIAFMRGQPHDGLAAWSEKMVCEQVYKPRAAWLEEAGMKLVDRIEGEHDLVLLLPERQREQTLADMARGFDLLKPGGTLVISLHNDWGAKRFEKHLEELASSVTTFSKHHCRVFWAKKGKRLNKALLDEWRPLADLRRVEDGNFWSKPGLFAWDHVDDASALLLRTLPKDLHGYVADLGAGWGCLSVGVLKNFDKVLGLEAFEADREAVEAARRNVGNVNVPFSIKIHPAGSTVSEVSLTIDGNATVYRNEPERWVPVTWPGTGTPRGAVLQARGAGFNDEIPRLGDFGLFRLLEAGQLKPASSLSEGGQVLTGSWPLSRAGETPVTLDVRPAKTVHPFTRTLFRRLRCPASVTTASAGAP